MGNKDCGPNPLINKKKLRFVYWLRAGLCTWLKYEYRNAVLYFWNLFACAMCLSNLTENATYDICVESAKVLQMSCLAHALFTTAQTL
jgi:hypothetical protein